MATPLGHSLAGYAVASRSGASGYYLFGLCILMANAPDLDVLPGLLNGAPALYHHGITHSIVFGIIVSLVAAAAYAYGGWPFLRIFYLSVLSYLTHLAMDFFGPDGRPPYGIPLFWPISDAYFISPVPIFLGMHHAGSTHASIHDWMRGVLELHNIAAVALEAVLIAPFILFRTRKEKARAEVGESIDSV